MLESVKIAFESAKITWLAIFVIAYWSYCLYWGYKGAQSAKTAADYFIANRKLSLWVFVLAATATSFSGWTFIGHPGLIYRDGFQYAYASFYAITIPFTGVMFLKRQWIIGKHFGYVTPGEMFSEYFKGDAIRLLTVLVALLFSVPYLGVQLAASGSLFEVLTDGALHEWAGMWVLSLVVLIYVASGGLRAVAYVDTLQCILLALGIIITGFIAYALIGGWSGMSEALGFISESKVSRWGQTAEGYNSYFAVPGVIQFTAGLGKETPVGGLWTGVMILTYMFALMGIQSSPAFTMWSFANTNPKSFAPQQVWASSFAIGFILFIFTAAQGVGALVLGANPEINDAGLAASTLFANSGINGDVDSLVPNYFNQIAESFPWLVGLLAVCALAAMQSTGAAYMSTASAMLTRDLYKHFFKHDLDHAHQKLVGRFGVAIIVGSALLVAMFSTDALVLLGGLAVAFGFQMWPSLAAVCWFPWITRQGATWGLAAGLIAVCFTESFGLTMASGIGIDLPWGRWPWTIHSAGWGIIFNVLVLVVVSAATQDEADRRRRERDYHSLLRDHAGISDSKRKLVPLAWVVTLSWFFFGIGPGAVIGNDIFGSPNNPSEWVFGIPSIWAWQIIFWGLGVFMMWMLAYKMEMSTAPKKAVKALAEDWGDTHF